MRRGTGYLAASTAGALNTLNALRPVARRGPLSVAAFANGFVTSELPLQTIGFQAGVTALALRRGVHHTRTGKLGLALTAASWAGLVAIERQSRQADPILEQALLAELGVDYRKRMAPAPIDARATWKPRLVPSRRLRKAYVTHDALAYGEFGRRNEIDIWRRDDVPVDGKAPVLFQVHGGAWVLGDKQGQAYPLMSHLAERGWVCVAVSYRLSPRATWPDHIIDVKRALAWVKEHIAEYGGDPDWVAITGGSAGGHLSSLAALTPNDPAFQPGFEDADTTVQAAVPFYGVYDWTNRDGVGRADMLPFLEKHVVKAPLHERREIYEQASPVHRIGPDAPPFFLLHGTNDSLVPVEQARAFAEELRKESSQPVVYAELPGAQHAFEVFGSVRATAAVHAVERFLGVVRAERT